jgi:hypothetical protein
VTANDKPWSDPNHDVLADLHEVALADLFSHGFTVVPPVDGDTEGLTMNIDYTEPVQ